MKMMGKFHTLLGFFLEMILLYCLQVEATTTDNDLMTTKSPSILTTQNPTTQKQKDPTTFPTTSASQETTTYTTQAATFGSTPTVPTTSPPMQLTTSKSPSPEITTSQPSGSTLPPEVLSSSSTITNTDEALKEQQTQAEICEENSKKQLLICLIVIGVLVFLCVCLLLAVAVMATKLSYVKRRQPSRRLPRTNGDFLSASSLWPAGLDTLERMSIGTGSIRQNVRLEAMAMGQGKSGVDASKVLSSEISERQKHKEMLQKETSIKRPNSTLTHTETEATFDYPKGGKI